MAGVALGIVVVGGIVASLWAWVALFRSAREEFLRDPPGRFVATHLFLTLLCLGLGIFVLRPEFGLIYFAFPPAGIVFLRLFEGVDAFVLSVLTYALPLAFIAALVAFAVRRLRYLSGAVAVVTLVVASVGIGEVFSRQAMCDAAQEFGRVVFKRTDLLTSIREAPADFQFVLHARLDVGDTAYGWSYGEMAWYEIPSVRAET